MSGWCSECGDKVDCMNLDDCRLDYKGRAKHTGELAGVQVYTDPNCRPGYYYVIPTKELFPTVPTPALTLTEDSAARKDTPMARGVLDYFPAALAYVAQVSAFGNAKHNPDSEELVWTRSKSYDHADCILRHLADRGLSDDAGIRHSGYVAWRALALLQTELEAEGAAPGRASVFDDEPVGAGGTRCPLGGGCVNPSGCATPCRRDAA